jgi:hypothetical protein
MAGWLEWALVGLAAWLSLSLLAAFLLTRVFALVRRGDTTVSEYREMVEFERWATAPLTGAGVEEDEFVRPTLLPTPDPHLAQRAGVSADEQKRERLAAPYDPMPR